MNAIHVLIKESKLVKQFSHGFFEHGNCLVFI